ncbi:hypothetical protein C8F01DRAFT_1321476 [Mycena amicta]|nr:hypothetical protein C8F01DRAFT_1321476 [Mycena amicta]
MKSLVMPYSFSAKTVSRRGDAESRFNSCRDLAWCRGLCRHATRGSHRSKGEYLNSIHVHREWLLARSGCYTKGLLLNGLGFLIRRHPRQNLYHRLQVLGVRSKAAKSASSLKLVRAEFTLVLRHHKRSGSIRAPATDLDGLARYPLPLPSPGCISSQATFPHFKELAIGAGVLSSLSSNAASRTPALHRQQPQDVFHTGTAESFYVYAARIKCFKVTLAFSLGLRSRTQASRRLDGLTRAPRVEEFVLFCNCKWSNEILHKGGEFLSQRENPEPREQKAYPNGQCRASQASYSGRIASQQGWIIKASSRLDTFDASITFMTLTLHRSNVHHDKLGERFRRKACSKAILMATLSAPAAR